MKFVIAPVNTPSLPYKFEIVDGGEFTVNSFYGSIHRQSFSLFAIIDDEGDIQPVAIPDGDPDPTPPSPTDEHIEEEEVPSDDETNEQEEHNGSSTSSNNEEDNDSTTSDDESNGSNAHGMWYY